MTDDRLSALEARVYQLHADNARLSESVDHLASAVAGLTAGVQDFRDTMNKGKGAVRLFGLVATGVGGLASWVMTRLFQ
jgi:hypothetical protein